MDFLRKTGIIKWNAFKKIVACKQIANKLKEKILDPCNSKEHYQSFIRKKKQYLKNIRNNYLSTKKFLKNPNINVNI